MGEPLIVALSKLAAEVQRGRSADKVLEIAGQGVRRLGLRLGAFQIDGDSLVLRDFATVPERLEAIEALIGRSVRGLRAPLAQWAPIQQVIVDREIIYTEDLDLFQRFIAEATGHDLSPLDASAATAGIPNGVLAPVFVANRPWGLLALYSPDFRPEAAAAVALFATHVGSALEAAAFVEELVHHQHLTALGELSAMVAHEVRNPLGAIFNAVTLLRRTPAVRDPGAAQLLAVVAEEASRLNEIVSDLLDFARPSGPARQRGSIRALAEDVLRAARQRPDASRARVWLDAPTDLPALEMDARLVRQALMNLVVNGLQAMPDGGSLTLRARLEESPAPQPCFIRLDVIDTGPGIPADQRPRVFEPFFTTKATGTGLGLPLVKRVIEGHGGDVGVQSGAEGTTFTLRLPIAAEPVTDDAPVRRAAGRPTPSGNWVYDPRS